MDGYVDWRGHPASKAQHGGSRAAAFVLVVVALETMALVAIENNLLAYLFDYMHFSLAKSANTVTNFIGTGLLMSLVGGFISDTFITRFWTIIIFGLIELAGFALLAIQAHLPCLRPAPCNMLEEQNNCQQLHGVQSAVFYVAFILLSLGSGSVNVNLLSMGADQFDATHPEERGLISRFFNKIYFSVSLGSLVSFTLLVWVQDNKGRGLGFAISAAIMLLAIVTLLSGSTRYRNKAPRVSPLTQIAQVFVAAARKRNLRLGSSPYKLQESDSKRENHLLIFHTDQFKFLNKAAIMKSTRGENGNEGRWSVCSISQVEEVKCILQLLPILACTIVINCAFAQLQTFSLQQGRTMNSTVGKTFHIPIASLAVIPLLFSMLIIPIYDYIFVKFARQITGYDGGISPLQRIGGGLAWSAVAMAVAALVEEKRKGVAETHGLVYKPEIRLPLSVFWLVPQFLIFSIAGFLTTVGFIDLLYNQSPPGMRSLATSLSFCSSALGYFLSSLIVSAINTITRHSSHGAWLVSNNLNLDRLDRFYWLLCGLSVFNLVPYIYWANWFRYRQPPAASNRQEEGKVVEESMRVSDRSRNGSMDPLIISFSSSSSSAMRADSISTP